ncbi:disease resistance TIR-NBS-LRR class family protein [Tanacetum coccineum]
MASSSNSSVQNSFKYDVFLSFRGEDTRKTFVDHLYHALMDKGIYTYKVDEKIQKGEKISDDHFKSIQDSKFYIIVFSKNYASSSWCLEELVKIMECQKMPEHTAYPVFYDVEPTEVRNQSGAVKKAFFKNKNKEAAEKWKVALKEAADLAGWELKNTLDGTLHASYCQKLKHLVIRQSKLRTFDLGLTPNLETLSLDDSFYLKELCMPVTCQKLKHLVIRQSKLRTFDLGLTPNLETLTLDDCADFEELHVFVTCPNLKFLNLHNSRLRSLNLELIPNLERLDLRKCRELVEVNAPVGCLKKVGYLHLTHCLWFTSSEFRGRSEPKVGRSSASLVLIGELLELCPWHPNSSLPKLRFNCYYEEYLPSSVGNIEKLISFGQYSQRFWPVRYVVWRALFVPLEYTVKHLPESICMLKHLKNLNLHCALLEKLPEDLGQLECLVELHVKSKKIEYLPDSICMLKRLKWLIVIQCCRLGMLPEDISQLDSLERLDLWGATIKHLPDSICMLKHLKCLIVDRCALFEKLPEDIGLLKCLKELDITDTGISHLPQSNFWIKRFVYYCITKASSVV